MSNEDTQTPPLKLWQERNLSDLAIIRAVPGGWVLTEFGERSHGALSSVYVPDPTAPHCAPAPATDERPPMTDAELVAWLTATHGEPAEGLGYPQWRGGDVKHDPTDEPYLRWHVEDPNIGWTSAQAAGPALWAAHKWGGR